MTTFLQVTKLDLNDNITSNSTITVIINSHIFHKVTSLEKLTRFFTNPIIDNIAKTDTSKDSKIKNCCTQKKLETFLQTTKNKRKYFT